MTNRFKYLLLAIVVALAMWGGIIGGALWIVSDGKDFTAGTKSDPG